jgi:hypothetical protein
MERIIRSGACGMFILFALLVSARTEIFVWNSVQEPSAAALIKKSLEENGPEAAREEFARILKKRDGYIFEEADFLSLGNGYLNAQKPSLAAAVFEMTLDAFPGSISALRLLAHSYYILGDEERSLQAQTKMMSARGKAELAAFLAKNKDSLASTAEDVIERCLEATGGRKAWEAVKTMVVVFSVQSTAGEQFRMERMYKRPNLYRQGLQGAADFIATDGTTCWRASGGEWKEVPNFHFAIASMDRWLLDYGAAGISHAFKGFDHINGSPVYHLRRTYRNGFVEDLYFSAVTNLLTEIRSDYVQHQPFMKSFMSLWNYREVSGVKIPYVFIRNLGPLEPPHGGVIEEVRVSVPLDDNLFLPPGYKENSIPPRKGGDAIF